MKPLSLRTRLTLYYSFVLAVLLAGFGALAYQSQATLLNTSLNQELEDHATGVRGYLRYREGHLVLAFDANDPGEAYFVHNATRYYQAFDLATGAIVVQSRDLELLGVIPPPQEVQTLAARTQITDVPTSQGQIRFHNSVFHTHNHRFLIRVGASLRPLTSALNQLARSLSLLIPAGIFLAGVGGWQMARWALRPTRELAAAARRIDVDKLSDRLPLRGTQDELDLLATAFNHTLARLDDSVGQMRQFTASVSHELRTPLTAMRGEAEVALSRAQSQEEYRRVLASQLEELDRLTRMVNQLLVLARAEAGEIAMRRQPVDLAALAASLVEQMEAVAAPQGVTLIAHTSQAAMVVGDPDWLERVILNLLDNAIKYSPQNGQVTLTVEPAPGAVRLIVRDTGSGIPPQALPHVFERFYRAEPSRSRDVEGIGLGLALVKWIVDHHDGRITVASQPGRGSCFTIDLPAAG